MQNKTQNTFVCRNTVVTFCPSSPLSPSQQKFPLQLRRSYWFALSPTHCTPYPVSLPILATGTALSLSLSLTLNTHYKLHCVTFHPTTRSTSQSLQWEPQISRYQSPAFTHAAGRTVRHPDRLWDQPRFLLLSTFTAIVDLSRFNNSCLKSPASTLVDLIVHA